MLNEDWYAEQCRQEVERIQQLTAKEERDRREAAAEEARRAQERLQQGMADAARRKA